MSALETFDSGGARWSICRDGCGLSRRVNRVSWPTVLFPLRWGWNVFFFSPSPREIRALAAEFVITVPGWGVSDTRGCLQHITWILTKPEDVLSLPLNNDQVGFEAGERDEAMEWR